MSVDNNELLMLLSGKKKSKQTIGVAGQQGFGVGVYGGDEADLTAMGLSPMDGCYNPASNNYGNYIHTNGSIMVFIPAFCYRIGDSAAPSYSRDTVNALEICSATEFANYEAGAVATGDMGDGWVLHRAFIDSGVQKRGFFIDKYLCSKSASDSNIAVSVKNADPLQLTYEVSGNATSGMTNCSGYLYDALTLSVARDSNYGCMTIFMFSALGMLSMAHGQVATSMAYCAWFDSSYTTNFPKGNNNFLTGDIDDTSITFTQASNTSYPAGKTGSASNFAKCTHNGQNCGVYGVNGDLYQVTVGFTSNSTSSVYILKESSKFNVITKDNYSSSSSCYDTFSVTAMGSTSGWNYWNPTSAMFYSNSSGGGRALCGVYPKSSISTSTPSKTLFGKDGFFNPSGSYTGTDHVLLVGGQPFTETTAGVWLRYFASTTWSRANGNCGFRATAYAG